MTEGLRALIVDDDPTICLVVSRRLGPLGLQSRSVTTGEAAFDAIASELPDVVFLDLSLPGISGLEVLERLRAEKLDLAVVLMTAHGSESVAADALRAGADDYLRKPFDAAEFSAVVRRTVDRLLLRRANAHLQAELQVEIARAARVQKDLLPQRMPELPGWELSGTCIPARTVGGDFFDVWIGPDGCLYLALGDVMGKGMPAALWMSATRAALRASTPASAADAVHAVDRAIGADLQDAGAFVTLVFARLEPTSGTLDLCDAGHGMGRVLRGTAVIVPPTGLPLGVAPELAREGTSIRMEPGDAFFGVTDGICETEAELDRIAKLLGPRPARDIVDDILALAPPSPDDDLTVLLLQRTAEP